MTNDIDFKKINAVSVAEKLYGTKTEYSWPGPTMLGDLDSYKNTCYGIVARFNGYDQSANLEQMKQIEAGQKCYEGIVEQYKKYGKHPYKEKIDQVIIPFYPSNFKDAYLSVKNKNTHKNNVLDVAYQKCLKMAVNNQQQKQCLIDKMAMENTMSKKEFFEKSTKSPDSNVDVNCSVSSLILWIILLIFLIVIIILKIKKII